MPRLTSTSVTWRLASACAATHLLGARLAAGPVPLRDVAMELLVCALVAAVPGVAQRFRPRDRWPSVIAVVACLALGALGLASLLYFGFGNDLSLGLAKIGALCVAVWGLVVAILMWRGREWLAPAYVVTWCAAMAVGWCARTPLAPDPMPWVWLGCVVLVGAAVARHRAAWALLAPVSAMVALVPGPARPAPPISWSADHSTSGGPDVVLIVADTLRNDVSTTLRTHRRLAAAGRDLGPAHASSGWTLPAMGSLMTGQPVSVHGAGEQPDGKKTALRKQVPTLAERLQGAGYDTAAVLAANPFVSATFGLQRGFDVFDYQGSHTRGFDPFAGVPGVGRPALSYFLHRTVYRTHSLTLARWFQPLASDDDAHAVTARALQVLQQRRERPLFMWVHLMDVHTPYPLARELELPSWSLQRLAYRSASAANPPAWAGSQETREVFHRAYDHQAEDMDRALLRFLDRLGPPPARGRVVILTADHGEEFWEHDGYGHGHAFWQEVIGVPLVIMGLATAPTSVAQPASQLDVMPTILDAAGLPSDSLPGRALQHPPEPRRLRSENRLYEGSQSHATREGAIKLIAADSGSLLFDLASDPAERQNVCGRLQEQCESLARETPAPALQGDAPEVTEAQRRALRALGYAE